MRVYKGDSITPNHPEPHIFVEIASDSFIEVKPFTKLDYLTRQNQQKLRAFCRKIRSEEKKTGVYHIRMARRYFSEIVPIPNLKLLGEF